jgi:hypothetical protein
MSQNRSAKFEALNLQTKRRLMMFVLLAAGALAMWLDRSDPFPVQVVRNEYPR